MNTEKHYADGGEPHYKRVKRLDLSWCRSNITKYAERTKGTPIDDLIKVIDYAAMELEDFAICTAPQYDKLVAVHRRIAQLMKNWGMTPAEPGLTGNLARDIVATKVLTGSNSVLMDDRQLYKDSGGQLGSLG